MGGRRKTKDAFRMDVGTGAPVSTSSLMGQAWSQTECSIRALNVRVLVTLTSNEV